MSEETPLGTVKEEDTVEDLQKSPHSVPSEVLLTETSMKSSDPSKTRSNDQQSFVEANSMEVKVSVDI